MDLIDRLKEISIRVPKLKEQDVIKTEEGTKNALVMPFINALGYNVFDPLEVTPELIADVGTKKGEKVDYAILKGGQPIILFECKSFGADLTTAHISQLYRYFSVTQARFGILTDGVTYKFFSDLKEPNKMDETPFLVIDITTIDAEQVDALKKFTKPAFDETTIINAASELKYRNAIKNYIDTIFTGAPPDTFVRFCLQESDAYGGRLTQTVLDDFRPITQDALKAFISDRVSKRLRTALETETATTPPPVNEDGEEEIAETEEGRKIVTTQEEIDGYFVVKSIVREVIDVHRITYRDAQSYFSVLVDDNNRRRIARLWFNTSQKYLEINDERIPIESIDDIYNYSDRLKEEVRKFIED